MIYHRNNMLRVLRQFNCHVVATIVAGAQLCLTYVCDCQVQVTTPLSYLSDSMDRNIKRNQ